MEPKTSRTRFEKHIVRCPSCGKDILDHMTVCPFCKASVTPSSYTGMDEKHIRTVRLVLAILLSLVILGLFLAEYLR